MGLLEQDELNIIIGFFTEHNVCIPKGKIAGLTGKGRLRYLLELARQENIIPSRYGVPEIRRMLRLYRKNVSLAYQYKAKPYSDRVTLFRARDHHKIRIDAGKNEYDETLGWRELVPGGIDVHIIPGNHSTMLDNPHIDVLAQHLKRFYDTLKYN